MCRFGNLLITYIFDRLLVDGSGFVVDIQVMSRSTRSPQARTLPRSTTSPAPRVKEVASESSPFGTLTPMSVPPVSGGREWGDPRFGATVHNTGTHPHSEGQTQRSQGQPFSPHPASIYLSGTGQTTLGPRA